ncbi:MAG: type III polyketide synthase [Acidobacteriota bacterium]
MGSTRIDGARRAAPIAGRVPTRAPGVAAVACAFPPHYHPQAVLLDALRRLWATQHHNPERVERLHRNVLVGGRHLALPIDDYAQLATFGDANDAWIRVALDVGGRALADALARSGIAPDALDLLVTTTVTGLATPSLDARLINRLGLPTRLKRLPLFGLGCVAGAAGIARAADHVRAYPDRAAALLAVELCSLTLQRQDLTIPNLIATGLFGDGAAAVVIAGPDCPRRAASDAADDAGSAAMPRVVATRSVFYPDTEDVMGWTIGERGFGIVLSAAVPTMVERHLRADVDAFLADHGLVRDDVATWICHPGGPKVLTAMESALALPADALAHTWRSLRTVGNLSSASVLMVLRDTLDAAAPDGLRGWAMLLAMGPGFCTELVLLRGEDA